MVARVPFQRWFTRIQEVVEARFPGEEERALRVACQMLAICVSESMCNPIMCNCRDKIAVVSARMKEHAGVTLEQMWAVHKPMEGELKGHLVCVRFEPSWWHQCWNYAKEHKLQRVDAAALACSWGIGQKWGLAYVMEHERQLSGGPMARLHALVWNPDEQLRQLLRDWLVCRRSATDNLALAFTRYNAGGGADHPSVYGTRAVALAHEYEKYVLRARELTKDAAQPAK